MSNTPVRKIIDLDTVLADMRARLNVVLNAESLTAAAAHIDQVFDDHRRAIDTLEAAVVEIRRILDQAEPASKDLPDMRGAEWALKCVRAEIRSALRGEG